MLRIRGLTHSYDAQPILCDVDLDVQHGEIMCLLGPSGCGKTTLLRLIAGLEESRQDSINFDGQSLAGIPAHQRDFGLMFQDFALFPHMSVLQNVEFGLKMHGMSAGQRREQANDALSLVGLKHFGSRDVAQLSGGERQRVALARSLAPEPRLLMLDEPLGSLDAALRGRLVVELRTIIQKLGLTAIYVTHDQHEAYAIADRIAIMSAGRIVEIAAPETIYTRPRTAFTARFLGLHNILAVTDYVEGCALTAVGCFPIKENCDEILLHPDGFELVTHETPGALRATVCERVFMGDHYRLLLQHSSGLTLLLKTRSMTPEVGDEIATRCAPEMIAPLLRK